MSCDHLACRGGFLADRDLPELCAGHRGCDELRGLLGVDVRLEGASLDAGSQDIDQQFLEGGVGLPDSLPKGWVVGGLRLEFDQRALCTLQFVALGR